MPIVIIALVLGEGDPRVHGQPVLIETRQHGDMLLTTGYAELQRAIPSGVNCRDCCPGWASGVVAAVFETLSIHVHTPTGTSRNFS